MAEVRREKGGEDRADEYAVGDMSGLVKGASERRVEKDV